MQYELFAVLSIIICLLILLAEYIWLAILAKRQEDSANKYRVAQQQTKALSRGFLQPDGFGQRKRDRGFKGNNGNDTRIFEMISAQLCFWEEYGDDETLGNKSEVIDGVYEALNPIKLFSDILKSGNKYKIGYACRRLADYDAYDYLEDIYGFSKSKNRNLSYNAAMALSRLGFADGVAEYILRIQDDKRYSSRIVNELFANFSSDRARLASIVFEKCNDYMKTTVINAIAPYNLECFRQLYIDGSRNRDADMRVACVRALGNFADEKNEHALLIAARDKDWVVRSAAVKGLQKLATPAAIERVKEATRDKEWWVRQAAAYSLIDMNVNISEIEWKCWADTTDTLPTP